MATHYTLTHKEAFWRNLILNGDANSLYFAFISEYDAFYQESIKIDKDDKLVSKRTRACNNIFSAVCHFCDDEILAEFLEKIYESSKSLFTDKFFEMLFDSNCEFESANRECPKLLASLCIDSSKINQNGDGTLYFSLPYENKMDSFNVPVMGFMFRFFSSTTDVDAVVHVKPKTMDFFSRMFKDVKHKSDQWIRILNTAVMHKSVLENTTLFSYICDNIIFECDTPFSFRKRFVDEALDLAIKLNNATTYRSVTESLYVQDKKTPEEALFGILDALLESSESGLKELNVDSNNALFKVKKLCLDALTSISPSRAANNVSCEHVMAQLLKLYDADPLCLMTKMTNKESKHALLSCMQH